MLLYVPAIHASQCTRAIGINQVIFLFSLILLAACAPESSIPVDHRWASINGGQIEKAQSGEEFYFNVPIDQSMLEPVAAPVRIQVSGKVNGGILRFELRRPGGQAVWNSGDIGPGDFSIQKNYLPERSAAGTYTLGLMWKGTTSASYNLSWHALQLGPSILVPGVGMLLVALCFTAYSARRKLGWRYLALGALLWVVTVTLKFLFAIPVNPGIYQALNVSYTDLFSAGNLVVYVYIGALTGFFESGVAWLILRKTRWGRASWGQALAFGIGFGAVEALLLSLNSLGTSVVGLLSPDALPVATLGGLAQYSSLLMGLAPVVERLSVISAHIFACVLLFYAIVRGEKKWVWLSILYKTILDAPGGFAAFWGAGEPGKLWTIEAVIFVIGLVGLWGTLTIARRYPKQEPDTAHPSSFSAVEQQD